MWSLCRETPRLINTTREAAVLSLLHSSLSPFCPFSLLIHLLYPPSHSSVSSAYPLVPFLLTHSKSKLHQCGSIHSMFVHASAHLSPAHTEEALHLFGFVFSGLLLNTCVTLLYSSHLATVQLVIQQISNTLHTYKPYNLFNLFYPSNDTPRRCSTNILRGRYKLS